MPKSSECDGQPDENDEREMLGGGRGWGNASK